MKKINNYEAKNPVITFRLHDEIAKKKLFKDAEFKNISHNTIARDIVLNYLKGDLVPKQKSIDAELQQARLEKIKLENKLLKMKIDFGENFGQPISNSGSRIYNKQSKIELESSIVTTNGEMQKSPYNAERKRLECETCGSLFVYHDQSQFIKQLVEYKNHQLAKHNRSLNPLEKDVIDKLTFEGESS